MLTPSRHQGWATYLFRCTVSDCNPATGWNQPASVNVNIANIPMPTEQERAEMRALDAKLDAIAAKLKA